MVAAREEGIIEIVLADAGEEIQTSVKRYNTAVDFVALTETNPTERPWLEYGIGRAMNEDEYIKLYITTVATDNVVYSSSKISIPCTKQNLTTGSISSMVLTAGDFDTWAAATTTGIPCTAGVRTYLGKYKVPAKQVIKLGNYTAKDSLDKNNGRILMVPYDDTA